MILRLQKPSSSAKRKKLRKTPAIVHLASTAILAVKDGTATWQQIGFLRRNAKDLKLSPDFRKLLYPQNKPEVMPADGAAGYTPGRRRAAGTTLRA